MSQPRDGINRERKPIFLLPVSLWVLGSFLLSSLIVGVVISILRATKVLNTSTIDMNVYAAVTSVAVYAILLVVTLGLPRVLKLWSARIGYRRLLGLTHLLQWRNILMAIIGFVIYLVLGLGVSLLVQALIPGFNGTEAQQLPFSKTLSPSNGALVFVTLVVVAPIAEEIIFRGYLFGTLRRNVPLWAAVLVTSLIFAALHLQWSNGISGWNVAIDVFVMSVVSCCLRYYSGSLWPSMLLHMMKNGLAFYVLYIAGSSIL